MPYLSPRSFPHPGALFSLVPVSGNKGANDIINHTNNSHHVWTSSSGELALDICFFYLNGIRKPCITLGRDVDADIYAEGINTSMAQCFFEFNFDTHIVMLYDTSSDESTQAFGDNAMQFENERDRKVVVQKGLNTIIGIGGTYQDLIRFRLEWHKIPTLVTRYEALFKATVRNPRLERTAEEKTTALLSVRGQIRNIPELRQLRMRYVMVGKLGSGAFGEVYKAMDLDSGMVMAVKILKKNLRSLWERESRSTF